MVFKPRCYCFVEGIGHTLVLQHILIIIITLILIFYSTLDGMHIVIIMVEVNAGSVVVIGTDGKLDRGRSMLEYQKWCMCVYNSNKNILYDNWICIYIDGKKEVKKCGRNSRKSLSPHKSHTIIWQVCRIFATLVYFSLQFFYLFLHRQTH